MDDLPLPELIEEKQKQMSNSSVWKKSIKI